MKYLYSSLLPSPAWLNGTFGTLARNMSETVGAITMYRSVTVCVFGTLN